ncbi:hypothetical protein QA596_12050 [Balneolales bacterium ANBcel1]|nr:hypothetical protein [Balneolales bacterium ANBcel1]
MSNAMRHSIIAVALFFFAGTVLAVTGVSHAQERVEPDLLEITEPLSPIDFDIRNGAGFRLQVNNFGFGAGAEYRRVLSRNRKMILEFQIGNVKDENEQTFQSNWGLSTIPNKYNRVMAFPLMLGVQQRFFARTLSDNFRLFGQVSGGPSPAFVYPYYDHDRFGYGFRITQGMVGVNVDPHYDPLEGWGDGEFILGAAGHLSIGANLGGDFGNIQTIRIGYFFHYFPNGIQVMEPKMPGPGFDFLPVDELPDGALQPAAGKQSFFGTPHITFVFGSMW